MATFSHLGIELKTDDDEEAEVLILGASKSGRGKHAEDVLINLLGEHDFGSKTVWISLTKSPCSSTYGTRKDGKPGCAEKIFNDLLKNGYTVNLTAQKLYGNSLEMKRNSCKALKVLKAAGAKITLTDNTISKASGSEETCDL